MSKINMKPVNLPSYIVDNMVQIERDALESGDLAWSPYSEVKPHSDGTYKVPVCSNGAGQLLVLLYNIEVHGIKRIFYPCNTFEGIKQTYKFLESHGVEVIEYEGGLVNTWIPECENVDTDLLIVTNIGGIYKNYDVSNWKHVVLDAAHAQFLGYEECLSDISSLVYSFFATKSTPVGEGGLIVTKERELAQWCNNVCMYDKPNFSTLGLNFRVSTSTYNKMIYMLTDKHAYDFLVRNRQKIFEAYAVICDDIGVEYVNDMNVNGYKFIITDSRISHVGVLTTSKSFEKYHNVCPATYPHLITNDEVFIEFENALRGQV